MKYFLIIVVFALSFDTGPVKVNVAGEMRRIMQQGDLRATIDLDTLKDSKHLVGLGVAENLKGEIILINGKSHITALRNDSLVNVETFQIKAALLVYSHVESWNAQTITERIPSLDGLQTFIEQKINEHHFDPDQPLPFIISTKKARIGYHVIDWEEHSVHTPANHKQFARSGSIGNEETTIVGFYSNHHQGIFTHHNSKIHVHVYGHESTFVGHVDEVQLDAPFQLQLPNL